MFTNIKPPQHIPRIHTHTGVIVSSKASQSHAVSQEVPKYMHTPANYEPVYIQNVLLQILGHYVVMYEKHTSHPPLHVKLCTVMNMFVSMTTWNGVGTCSCTEHLFFYHSDILQDYVQQNQENQICVIVFLGVLYISNCIFDSQLICPFSPFALFNSSCLFA